MNRTRESVGEIEFRLLLGVSVVCTILVVAAYFRISSRRRKSIEKNEAVPVAPKKKVTTMV